jgi:hypothetical protein
MDRSGLVVPVLFMALVFAPLLVLFMFLFWSGFLAVLDIRLEFAEIRTAGLKDFRCGAAPVPRG